MTRKKAILKEKFEILEHGHEKTAEKIHRLREVLTDLRYEGRASLGKNLKETQRVLKFFKEELVDHVQLEEKIISPYLETHVPKLESAISLLRSDHVDFKKNLGRFEWWLGELTKKRNHLNHGKIIEKVKEIGTYLTYLLQNHLQVEEVVFKVANRELRREEKRELWRLQRRQSHGTRRTR